MKLEPENASRTRKARFYIIAITFVAALGGLLFGYDTGVIGGSQLYFTEYFNFSATQQGWAVGSALFGCLLGASISGFLIKQFSQKQALLLSAFLFTVSAWGSGIPESLNTLVLFRIIGGVGLGIASMAAPMYIAEIAPPKLRGRLVSYYQLAIVIGFFVVFVATYFIGGGNTYGLSQEEVTVIHDYNVSRGWRVMFWSELIPSSLFFILLLFVPNSPRGLMRKGLNEEAKVVLYKMNDTDEVAELEYLEIERSLKEGVNIKKASPLQPKYRKVLFIGIALSILQQVTGINAILYYGAEIFSNALGYGPEDALKQQILLGFVNLVFTFVAIYSVDKWGRKPLLIMGVTGMLIGLLTVGLSLYTGQLGIISLIGILVFIASFALSMGPVTWVLLSEIFPNKIRGMAMSIAVAAQWLFNGIVASVFPVLVKSKVNETSFHGSLPYFIFGFFCVVTIVFVYRMIPETKNKSLEELERIWD